MPDNKGESRQEIRLSNVGKSVAREEVAHFINDYFVYVGKPTFAPTVNHAPEEDRDKDIDLLNIRDFTETEVFELVKGINISKSSGIDNISS